ncbi:MAG: Holliday junction resolvase RuvX [Paraperlucidibaca sp.]
MPDGVLPDRLLAFDFGTKRIGVAGGLALTGIGSPQVPIPARDGIPDWALLDALIADWRPVALLVGNPLNMDDTPSEIGHRALKFARRLAARYPALPVYRQDERLTTRGARETLADVRASRGGRLPSLDSTAACLIVESWFDSPNWQRV